MNMYIMYGVGGSKKLLKWAFCIVSGCSLPAPCWFSGRKPLILARSMIPFNNVVRNIYMHAEKP